MRVLCNCLKKMKAQCKSTTLLYFANVSMMQINCKGLYVCKVISMLDDAYLSLYYVIYSDDIIKRDRDNNEGVYIAKFGFKVLGDNIKVLYKQMCHY